MNNIEDIISGIETIRLKRDVPTKNLSTFSIGGIAKYLIEVTDLKDTQALLTRFKEHSIPFKILGNSSNVIISDCGIEIPIIILGKNFNRIKIIADEFDLFSEEFDITSLKKISKTQEQIRIFAYSAYSLMKFCRNTVSAGYSGLEFAAGIPASIGGAIMMNAGAHGGSIFDILKEIYLLDHNLNIINIQSHNLNYGYRNSGIASDHLIIGGVFEFCFKGHEVVHRDKVKCLEYRQKTQPLNLPSAGSVFKNPSPEMLINSKLNKSTSAAELLEACNLKGLQKGGIQFSTLHANWLVKIDDIATVADFTYLVNKAKEAVERKFKIVLETEIRVW